MPPQLEDGYLMIANELFDALVKYRIPGEQRQCLDFIIRKTYGFRKLEDQISNSQFVKATGLKPGNITRALKALVQKKIVIKSDNEKKPKYRINKHYQEWQLLSKVIKDGLLSKVIIAVIKSDKNENGQKNTILKPLSSQYSEQKEGNNSQSNAVLKEKLLLSKVMDTKDSNNVTKERENPERVQETKKAIPVKSLQIRIKILTMIISGNQSHAFVGDYGHIGESFPEMQVRARRELEKIRRELPK